MRPADPARPRHALARAALRAGDAEIPLSSAHELPLNEALFAAELLLARPDVAGALRLYEAITAQHPDCAEAWFRRGLLLQERGDLAAARAAWQRCLGAEPARADAWQRLATMWAALERWTEAVACCERALDAAPGSAWARLQLACAFARLNWWDRTHAALAALPPALPGFAEHLRREVESGWRARVAELRAREREPAAARDAELRHSWTLFELGGSPKRRRWRSA